jgi:hypothetical protein
MGSMAHILSYDYISHFPELYANKLPVVQLQALQNIPYTAELQVKIITNVCRKLVELH